jgi:hypothetical protein
VRSDHLEGTECLSQSAIPFDGTAGLSFASSETVRVHRDETCRNRGVDRGKKAMHYFCFARCCDPRYFLQVKLESGPKEGPDDEAIEVYGRADHCVAARAGGRAFDRRGVPQARDQHGDLSTVGRLSLAGWRCPRPSGSSILRTRTPS